jgi:predicted DNA-binding protein
MENEDELVHQTVRLPRGLLRRMKVYAAMNDTTQQALTIEAIERFLDEREKPKR